MKKFVQMVADFQTKYAFLNLDRMAVYGTGKYAVSFIRQNHSFQIQAVIDRVLTDGEFEGIPVLTIDKAIHNGVNVIVIAASLYNEKIIYDRIKGITDEYALKVYGLHGGDLNETYKKYKIYNDHEYNRLNENDIKKLIDSHEVISFDIFDTMIGRRTLIPQDVFMIVEAVVSRERHNCAEFGMRRIQAERIINYKVPTLNEIYEELGKISEYNPDELEYLKNCELAIEKKVVARRECGIELFKYAIEHNKKVALVSDMYLSADQIKELLEQCGIIENVQIFVSSEHRTTKAANLFDVLKESVFGTSYLHIGDNRLVDCIGAVVHEMNSVLLNTPEVRINQNGFSVLARSASSINERNMIGLMISKLMNHPLEEKFLVNSVYDFAYIFIAPIITTFVIWLVRLVTESGFDAILFPSRDGYLLHKLYDIAKREMNIGTDTRCLYLYTSRKACIRATCNTQEAIELFNERLGLSVNDIFCNIFNTYNADQTTDMLFSLSKDERDGYIKYIRGLGLKKERKYGFVDLCSSGTCHSLLESIFFDEMEGLFLCHRTNFFNKKSRVKALYKEHYLDWTNVLSLINNIVILESVITSFEASVKGFDKEGNVKFEPENRSGQELRQLEEAHQGITDYFCEFIRSLYIKGDEIHPSLSKLVFTMYESDQIIVSDEVMSFFKIDDPVLNKTFVRNGKDGNT